MRKPCSDCEYSIVHKGRYNPSYSKNGECFNCERYDKYQQYLENKRKYTKGKPITTIDELMNCKLIYWHNRIFNIQWILNQQFNVVMCNLNQHNFYQVVLKENT